MVVILLAKQNKGAETESFNQAKNAITTSLLLKQALSEAMDAAALAL